MTNEQYSRFVESNELPQYTNRNKKDLWKVFSFV
jgi:hypothetical protein